MILVSTDGALQVVNLLEFLHTDMKGKVIYSITLPPLSDDHAIKTFKIMPRSCNAHAYINAGFCAKFQRENSIRIVGRPTLLFGGLRASLVNSCQFCCYSIYKVLLLSRRMPVKQKNS